MLIACDSPRRNPYIERMIGTLRRELLNHVIVRYQSHLERLLEEHLEQHYHAARPHQGLGGETPAGETLNGEGEIMLLPVVSGLRHRCWRVAA